jgi:galactokinase
LGPSVEVRARALAEEFRRRFGREPEAVVRAPGRVELIGGHTDYNEGFVMPAAIDRDVLIAGAVSAGDSVRVWSVNFGESSEIDLTDIRRVTEASWSNYIRGVLDQFHHAGRVTPPMDAAVEGNIPPGSGLSSSAALEVATACLILKLTDGDMDGRELALLCQRAENEFVGVNCGIMDQFVSVLGQAGKTMFLDCRSLDHQFASLPRGTRIVVADSKKPRTLAGSEYNVRRAQCEEAVNILRKHLNGIRALRDVSIEDLERHGGKLPDVVRKRARHVVHENERVLQALRALNSGSESEFGNLLNQSHASARDLYEISCDELNWLQEAAVSVPGCLGSRLMGGGFGGCTVSVVRDESVEQFRSVVSERYARKSGFEPDIFVLNASDGAGRVL